MDVIAKKYRVLKSLGQGAMGEVFLVLPPKGDPVALKLLKTLDAKSNMQAIDQFENEFKVLKRLSHPNIGRIYDYGYDEELKKVFFTLPWLTGTDIYNATEGADFATCEEYFIETLRALNYLHQKNLIHCDLKPGNIYVENNKVLLIDFGLAGYWGENIVGTPTYLAPEVFRGAHHNVASDLYACGVIIYNCLTRTQPFSGKTLQEVYDRHRGFTPPPITEINPKVPKYFSDIVAALLNKKPKERFPSAASVIEEIDAYSSQSYPIETEDTLLSYIPTESDYFGKQDTLEDTQIALDDFRSENVREPYHVILIHGQKNVGKSRLVAKIRNELQLSKNTVENINTPITEQERKVVLASKAVILENLENYFITADEVMQFKKVLNVIEGKILSTATTRFMLIVSSIHEKDFDNITKLFPQEESRITTIKLTPYTRAETEVFLLNIIGQKEIPQKFVDKFHQNTEGLPGIALQLIQSMIENGLLFDKSGRWNEDLIADLDKSLDGLAVSESLEQDFERIYDSLSGDEEDIVKWLCLCPHPLHFNHLQKLTKLQNLDQILEFMVEKKIIREENKDYSLYRSVFQNFIRNNLPDSDVKQRHTVLANPKIGLDKKWAIYHLSYGKDINLRLKAILKLTSIYKHQGERESSLETFLRLIREFGTTGIHEKLAWYIEASALMISLDRFKEATDLLTVIEKEIHRDKVSLDPDKLLTLLEKKGLALLHQEKLEKARSYFENGLRLTQKFAGSKVQRIRFENNIAEIEFMIGHQDKAIEIFKKTREVAKNFSNIELENITNNDLGHVYLNLQKYDDSMTYLKEDIIMFSSLKHREPLARALYSYGEVMRAKGNIEKASKAYEECIHICKAEHSYPLLLRAYNGLGNLFLSNEKNEEALRNYQKALDIAVRLKHISVKAALLYNQGYIYNKEKNSAMATRRYMMAKQVLENKEGNLLAYEENLLSRCYNELALSAIKENNTMKALSFQLERLKLVDDSETLRGERFNVKLDLADLYLDSRLSDQFLKEIESLDAMASGAEEIEKINSLKKKHHEIMANKDQDATGHIQILTT